MKQMVRGLIAVWVVVAVLSHAAAPAARAAYPGNNGLLLFEGWGAAGWSGYGSTAPAYDLWTVTADGSGLTNVTNTPGVEANAQWSPDGKRITFDSNRTGNYDIYVMNPDGSGVERLTSSPGNETSPTWSPNGRRIAYVSERARQPEIIVMRSDGTRKRSLGTFPGYIWGLAWSPAAPKIAFVRESKVEGHYAQDDNEDLYSLNVRTKRVSVLADSEVPEFDPVWSPDGKWIAFARDYCSSEGFCSRDRVARENMSNTDIVTVRSDGSDLTRITRTSDLIEFDPAWSPDGTMIAYARFDEQWVDIDLFVMNRDGSHQRALVMKPDSLDYQVDWQPVP